MNRPLCKIVPLALLLMLGLGGPAGAATPPVGGLVEGRLRPCPASPNCLCSEDGSGAARLNPLDYSSSTAQAWQLLKEVLVETDGVIVEEGPGYLRAVYTSTFLRFKDDVEFRLDRENPVIQMRSASRTGYWDLGANRRRLERIRRLFTLLDERNSR